MFEEYSITNPRDFTEYIGFTENEVKDLCDKYGVNYSKMESWYDGHTLHQLHQHQSKKLYRLSYFHP